MDCSGKLASLNATAASAKGTQSCTGYFTGGSGGTTVGTSSCTGCGAWGTCSGGTCKATACKTGYYYSNGSCTSCTTVKNTALIKSTSITGGTRKETCSGYYTGGAGSTSGSGSCTGCSASTYSCSCNTGYHVSGSGSSCTCVIDTIQCAAGTYYNASTKTCQNCTAGNYCSGGTYSKDSTNHGISSCPSSGTSDSGASTNTSCYVTCPSKTITGGTATQNSTKVYYNGSSYPTCTYSVSCNSGYGAIGNNTASPSCSQCSAGQYSAGGTATCQSCAPGTYNSSAGQANCSACGANYYCPGGSTHTSCGAGKTTNSKTNATAASDCVCSAGYGGTNGTCTACVSGTYKASAGNTNCTSASAGNYVSGTGNTSQSPCNGATQYQDQTGQSSCKSVDTGYYKENNSAQKLCPTGYQSGPGAENQNKCQGKFTKSGTRQECSKPANCASVTCGTCTLTPCTYTQTYGGSMVEDCTPANCTKAISSVTASSGYYANGTSCTKCPTGYPNSDSGNSGGITKCYSNDKSRTWTGKQNDPTLPSGCSKMTTNACSKAACNYKMYSNSAGNGDGEFHSGCQTNNEACAKTIASVEASAGNYVNGTTCPTCTSANSTYPKSDGGAIGSGYCYREVTLTGKQNNPATLAGCSTRTLTDCKPSSCTYKDYYSANDTPCTPDDCTKTQTCTSADKNYYLDKGVAKTCSSFSPTYTKSDGGNITNAYCYQLVTKNGVQNEGRTPSGCASVTEWNSCTTKSCEYKDYYTAADETCTPTDCTKSAKSVMASAGSYVSGSICKTCPDKSYCPGGTYTLSSSDQGLNPCPTGADGSDSNRSALAHCYKNCPVKEISGGTTTKVSEKVQYTGTQYADCKYYVNCYAGYGAAGDGTTNPTCTQCPVGQFSAGVKNTCANCSNAPENSTYTSNSNTNNCSWSCNSGYGQTFQSKCVLKCTAGISTLHAGDKVSVQLYDTKSTTPSIVIQKGDKMCYGNLTTGSGTNALNVQYNNQNYHTVN